MWDLKFKVVNWKIIVDNCEFCYDKCFFVNFSL